MPWKLRLLALVGGCAATLGSIAAERIDFAREIQPLLAQRCYDCHGAEKAKGGLRLTSLAAALEGGESGEPALVPRGSSRSGLLRRVTSTDDDEVMPQKGPRLTPAEVALLTRWIDEGAEWPENLRHWAYVKPVRPAVPAIAARMPGGQPVNAIDAFVLQRLAPLGLAPAPEVDRPRWLRRVSLDLIGLPPTPDELRQFLADTSPLAHERVVDRLLASPHYGERWARPWLDLARYADSHGFQRDDLRDLWPYRDWVIRAMNADMPFDQFTIWQIAGDLLPGSTNPDTKNLDALIATGFHRCAPTNVEAGTDQEEGRVNQVFDRVNTTAAVWLGSTLECAQCHNHKYDPFTQKDYYRLFAFFNNTPRETEFTTPKAMASLKFSGPYVELPDPATVAKRIELNTRIKNIDRQIAAEKKNRDPSGRRAWEAKIASASDASAATHALEIADFESLGGSVHRILPDHSVLLVDEAPDRDTYVIKVNTKLTGITAFKLEALTDPSLPGSGPGRGDAARPNFILNSFTVAMASTAAAQAQPQPVRLVRATASYEQPRFPIANALKPESDNRAGWAIAQQFHRAHWAIFETEAPVGSAEGVTFTFTLVQNFGAGRTIGRVRLSALTGPNPGAKALPAEVVAAARKTYPQRTAAENASLAEYYYAEDKVIAKLTLERQKLMQDVARLKGPQTLVMRELEEARATTVFNRGNFLDPGEPVTPGTPPALHPAPWDRDVPGRESPASPTTPQPATRPTRLDLARWLVDRDNPLVARVTVNRWWAEFFGRGLVGTPEDFGVKGEPPTHPALLDWLAVEFMEAGWSMKHIHKLITLSSTYRQSSRISPEQLARDDQNKWLARGPRFRLDAETIRDNALFAAGLLSLKLGGPPVRPYQPPGLWENKVGGERVTYDVSPGEDARRRGIYTVWKRASPYPSFMNFDATARTACTVRRSRSNTPLQALTLLNDPVYVEAALALAKRVVDEFVVTTPEERVRWAFRLCLTRDATAQEAQALVQLYEQEAAAYAQDAPAARALIGNFKAPDSVTPAEFAAWHAVMTALLNLDEMITK